MVCSSMSFRFWPSISMIKNEFSNCIFTRLEIDKNLKQNDYQIDLNQFFKSEAAIYILNSYSQVNFESIIFSSDV